MASTMAVPLMSSVDSSHYLRSHSYTASHQRGSQRLTRPFSLARIPSERLDPRSDKHHQNPNTQESDAKGAELGNTTSSMNNASAKANATNATISVPSLSTNGPLNEISKRARTTTPDAEATDSFQSPAHAIAYVDAKARSSAANMVSRSRSHSYLRAVFAGLILPSPYILLPFLSTQHVDPLFAPDDVNHSTSPTSELFTAVFTSLVLTTMTLASIGGYGWYKRKTALLSGVKSGLGVAGDTRKASHIRLNVSTVIRIVRRSASVLLPYTAALLVGSLSVSVLLLVVISSGLVPINEEKFDLSGFQGWRRLIAHKFWSLAYTILLCLAAFQYGSISWLSSTTGILAVVMMTLVCNPPYLVEASPESSYMSPPPSARSTSAVLSTAWDAAESSFTLPVAQMSSPLIASTEGTCLTLISAIFTATAAGFLYLLSGTWAMTAESAAILILTSFLSMWSYSGIEIDVFRGEPISLATGLAAAVLGNMLLPSNLQPFWQDGVLAAMAFMAVRLDGAESKVVNFAHVHPSLGEMHLGHGERAISAPSKVLLQSSHTYSLLHGILADKDSRRIFYFMLLNLSFMLVQSTYGILTGSLGLMSDSIHMFFDCFALLVGLCAAVMSKWPPSVKYPYGYGKMDTLAGFGNGIFLMLISIEIVWEAIERLVEGSDVSRTMELLIVSSLGLVVNLIGIMAFEHGHGGHSHGHGGHSHSHEGHAHSHSGHAGSPTGPGAKSGHTHHHGGDNMYGIYLHIMADALGSVAVVISTLCVRYFGWSGFDPLASCAIAILIFASAIPLVFSSGKKLLLSLPGDIEYTLRDTLAGVSTIRGVVGYSVPKFWLDDIGKRDSEHEHDHDHHDHHDHHHDHDHDGHEESEHCHGHGHSHAQHQDHGNDHSGDGESSNEPQLILGVIHVIASQHANLDDVRNRVLEYLKSKNMDIIIQVERSGDVKCWCGGSQKSG